jgi:flagellar hook-associated protein 1
MGLTGILNIARNALSAQQTAMQVVSNNIANANTEGYARQEAVFNEEQANVTDLGLFLGNGVSISMVKIRYDKYLENTIAKENTALEEQKTNEDYLTRVETVLNEDNTKLTSNLVSFFNSWQDLSTDPLSETSRTNVATQGANLANGVRTVYGELQTMQTEADDSVAQKVNEITDTLRSIAQLNIQIVASGSSDGENQTFVNQRTQLVKQLSGILDIQSFEDQSGALTVMTSAGKTLVVGGNASELQAVKGSTDGFNRVMWSGSSSALTDITDTIQGGSLKSLIDLRDNKIAGFLGTLNDLAKSVMTEVNTVHQQGYNANGSTGINFFKDLTSDFALNFDLSDEIKADPSNIATTSDANSSSGNDVALAIANLGTASVTINGKTTTYSDYGASIASHVGSLSQNATSLSGYHQTLMASLNRQRDGISGVSIDEEMTNLIKFQYAYQAAARLLTVADKLMDSLLGIG